MVNWRWPEACFVRPVFFAPWWWFVWSSGKRFSLRRALSLAVGVVIAAELVAAGVRYAFRGQTPTVTTTLAVGATAGIASLAYSLVEPIFVILRDSIASRSLRFDRLRDVSYGLQVVYAVGLAYASFAIAPRVPTLAALLAHARTASGELGGDARYIIGASIVFLPVVLVVRYLAMQVRTSPTEPTMRVSKRRIPRVDRTQIPNAPVPGPTPIQRAARIINVEIGPSEPSDRS